jgi:hypothetical protein
LHQIGYTALNELARLIVEVPAEDAPNLWRPVFALGPRGHSAIGHFLRMVFHQISEKTESADFAVRWRPMADSMVRNSAWAEAKPWFHVQRLERAVLGFSASVYFQRLPNHTSLIIGMRDLYEHWATHRLIADQDNVAEFCSFLSTQVGVPLRIDGLKWIANALTVKPQFGRWFREQTWGAFVEFLDMVVTENASEIARDHDARQALLDLAALAVARQTPAAQVLQERIRDRF